MGVYYQEDEKKAGTWGVMIKMENHDGTDIESFTELTSDGWMHCNFALNSFGLYTSIDGKISGSKLA